MLVRSVAGGLVGFIAYLAVGVTTSYSADLDQCMGSRIQIAQCECNKALSIGTEEALQRFMKRYNGKGTACSATASTAPQASRNWNSGSEGHNVSAGGSQSAGAKPPSSGGGGSGTGGSGGGGTTDGEGEPPAGSGNPPAGGGNPPTTDNPDKGGADPHGEEETTPPASAFN
jgi:hypothetical protein